MKQLIFALLLILCLNNASAQKSPPPYFLSTDTIASIRLPANNWQMMAAHSGKMTLQQVRQSNEFQDTDRKIQTRRYFKE